MINFHTQKLVQRLLIILIIAISPISILSASVDVDSINENCVGQGGTPTWYGSRMVCSRVPAQVPWNRMCTKDSFGNCNQ